MAGIVVVGAGPGIGRSVARRFAKEGMPVALVARSRTSLDAVAGGVRAFGVPVVLLTADVTDASALRSALDAVVAELGPPDVVVYNAAVIRSDRPGELTVAGHQEAWAVNVVGAVNTAAHVAPRMRERAGGTLIVTSGMPSPDARYVSLSLGKAGVRALVAMLDQEYGRDGVHVAAVTVAGDVAPGTAFDPDDIAEHYWRLHRQRPGEWTPEVVHSG